eukprot:COSAG01_NODE_76699_length_179_cov_30.550000_1_plen_32_part_10
MATFLAGIWVLYLRTPRKTRPQHRLRRDIDSA